MCATRDWQPALPEDLTKEVRRFAKSLGAELFGVASAEEYERRFPDKPAPSRFVVGARSVVVIGLPFEPGTIATVLRPELAAIRKKATDRVMDATPTAGGAERYFLGEENGILIRELALLGYKIVKFLRKNGCRALHLPPCKQDNRFRTAPFYHMPAMYLAGMGTYGLNCSILTPQFGPRVFVTSIITDGELCAGQPMSEELCTDCRLCVEHCPIQALDGNGKKNAFACASYGCCSTCIAICPIGEV